MLVSASRRTDIPAFFTPWLLNRLRAGFVLVRNPFNRRMVSRVRLDPSVVEALVLWTKNPAPFLPHWAEVESMGYPVVMQYTITACDPVLEPGLPSLDNRIASFQQAATRWGAARMLWRCDPLIFTKDWGPDAVLRRFTRLARALCGMTSQCTISFVSLYAKCRRNLRDFELVELDAVERQRLIAEMTNIAAARHIQLRACCDAFLSETCQVPRAHCIDGAQIGAIIGQPLSTRRDTSQRPGCGCTVSVDIGAYDSCAHGCRYCYANTSDQTARRNLALHDPASPLLIGSLQGDETIRERDMAPLRILQPQLFSGSIE